MSPSPTTAPVTSPTPSSTPTATPLPANLVGEINHQLDSTKSTAQFETTPNQIVNYLKTVNLPMGSKIQAADAQIVGGQLVTSGAIATKAGQAKFTATLENDTDGGRLKVVSHSVDLPFLARGFRSQIDSQITNFNSLITSQINRQIKQGWQVSNVKIIEDKLAFDFVQNMP